MAMGLCGIGVNSTTQCIGIAAASRRYFGTSSGRPRQGALNLSQDPREPDEQRRGEQHGLQSIRASVKLRGHALHRFRVARDEGDERVSEGQQQERAVEELSAGARSAFFFL